MSLAREWGQEARAAGERRREAGDIEQWGGGHTGHSQPPQPPPYLFGDVAVLVNVVKVKGPLEFLVDCSSQEDGETNHKVLWRKGRGRSDDPALRFYFQFAVWLPLKFTPV